MDGGSGGGGGVMGDGLVRVNGHKLNQCETVFRSA